MTHLFVLWFALFAAQATTPATPPPSEPPAAQPAHPSQAAPSATTPDQAAPAKPPSPNANASGPSHRNVTAPRVIYQPDPRFAMEANNQNITGVTVVQIIVDEQGNPQNVHVVHSLADTVDKKQRAAALTLDQVAIDAVKKYQFTPGKENGNPSRSY